MSVQAAPAERLATLRAGNQARKEAEYRASYRWKIEGVWPAGTSIMEACKGEDCPPVLFEHAGRTAARQLRSSALDRHVSRPWRVVVVLAGGEVVACTCLVPPWRRDDPGYLAGEAERVAVAELSRRRPQGRQWWQDQ